MNQIATQHKQNVSFLFDGMDVRVVVRDGEPWFVAADVCAVLNIANHKDAVAGLDEDEKDGVGITDPIGRTQATTVINESGLYSVIFKSRKPEAKAFKKWVTSEVLPAIRKTGGYSVAPVIPQTLSEALRLAADIEEQRAALEAKVAEDAPKVEFYHDVTGSDSVIDMATVAKVLNRGIGRNQLFAFLRKEKVLDSRNAPYQRFIDMGWFRQVETKWQKPNGDWQIGIKTGVFQKGVEGIARLLDKKEAA